MTEIDDRFIDVDFREEPSFVFGDLGRNPSKMMCASADDEVPLIPEAKWRELAEEIAAKDCGLDKLVVEVKDQKQEGSCVANATVQLHQVMQAASFGKSNVTLLSAISLYKRIGSSPNSGAMVDDAMDEITDRGALPLDNAPNRSKFGSAVMPATGFYSPYPVAWESTAKKFRGDERLIVQSEPALFSSLFSAHPVVVGRQGHSVLYLRPIWDGSKWLIKYVNSWRADWGDNGFGYDTLRQYRESAQWAFTLRSILVPSVIAL